MEVAPRMRPDPVRCIRRCRTRSGLAAVAVRLYVRDDEWSRDHLLPSSFGHAQRGHVRLCMTRTSGSATQLAISHVPARHCGPRGEHIGMYVLGRHSHTVGA